MNKTVKIIVYVVGFFILMGVVNWCSSCGSEKKKSRDEIINEAIAANDFHTCDSVLIAVKDGCDGVYRLNEYYWPRAQKIVKAQADYLIETDDPELWICSFTDPPLNRRQWTLWQHSHRSRIPGVKGFVDLNTFNGDRAAWERWLNNSRNSGFGRPNKSASPGSPGLSQHLAQ